MYSTSFIHSYRIKCVTPLGTVLCMADPKTISPVHFLSMESSVIPKLLLLFVLIINRRSLRIRSSKWSENEEHGHGLHVNWTLVPKNAQHACVPQASAVQCTYRVLLLFRQLFARTAEPMSSRWNQFLSRSLVKLFLQSASTLTSLKDRCAEWKRGRP